MSVSFVSTEFTVVSCEVVGPYPKGDIQSIDSSQFLSETKGMVRVYLDTGIHYMEQAHPFQATHHVLLQLADGHKAVAYSKESAAQALRTAFHIALAEQLGGKPVALPENLPNEPEKLVVAVARHMAETLQQRRAAATRTKYTA